MIKHDIVQFHIIEVITLDRLEWTLQIRIEEYGVEGAFPSEGLGLLVSIVVLVVP